MPAGFVDAVIAEFALAVKPLIVGQGPLEIPIPSAVSPGVEYDNSIVAIAVAGIVK